MKWLRLIAAWVAGIVATAVLFEFRYADFGRFDHAFFDSTPIRSGILSCMLPWLGRADLLLSSFCNTWGIRRRLFLAPNLQTRY